MHVVRQLDERLWRDFVKNNPRANIFHTPEMFQVFAQGKGYRPSLWAAVSDDGYPLALLVPVRVTLMDGLLHRLTTRSVAYGSVLCAPDSEGKDALALLLQSYTQEVKGRSLFTELRNLTDLSGLQRVLTDNGFVYEDHLNFLVDLDRSPEAILQSFGRRTRKQIRRELRRGELMVEEVEQREQVALCYQLLERTYANASVPLADWSLFEAAFEILHPQGMVKFLLVRLGDSYVAGSVELIYRDTIYGWYGGVERGFSNYVPNELLQWHIFRWGAENGYKMYDFGGAGKPDEEYGVRDFKAKFGGELVCYGRNTYVHARRSLWLSKQGYRLVRRWL